MTSFTEFFSQNPSSIFQNICAQSSTHFDKILIIISHPNQNSKSLKLQLINSPTYKPPIQLQAHIVISPPPPHPPETSTSPACIENNSTYHDDVS